MKKTLLIVLCIALYINSTAQKKGKLIFEENFKGKELNTSHWNFELGDGCPYLCGWGNNERQVYTDTNHRLKGRKLFISAKNENGKYTSTRITTKNKVEFQYGTVEVRAKLPQGFGLWPAIWMLGSDIDTNPWPACGEIDIMEYVGKEPNRLFNSMHTPSSHGNTINTKKHTFADLEKGFHVYKMVWTKDAISFFMDDMPLYTYSPKIKNKSTWPYDKPFYLLINLAIGGNFGGPKVDDSIFPQEFIIDYVRVYK